MAEDERPDLTDDAIRLQVLLERVKAGENVRIDAFLQEVAREVTERLKAANLTAGQTERLEGLLSQIEAMLGALHRDYLAGLTSRLGETGEAMADAEARALAAALQGFDVSSPAANVVRTAITTAPLSVRGAGGGLLLEQYLAGWSAADVERVVGVIRRGYFEGRTTEQVVRDVIGTKTARYQDGIIDVSRRTARTVVHTALQHVANTARMETLKHNDDIIRGYRWVSTLDSRTTEVCRSLDGREFEIGKGPVPPAHPNCRSTIVPVTKTWRELGIDIDEMPAGTRASVNGQVPATLTYYEWLKTQPASFVEETLGPTKAALFLKGGLSPDEFSRLQLNKSFEPLSIEELRKLIPQVFKRAGLTA